MSRRAQAFTLALPDDMRHELQRQADARGLALGSYIKTVLTFELTRLRAVEAQRAAGAGRERRDVA